MPPSLICNGGRRELTLTDYPLTFTLLLWQCTESCKINKQKNKPVCLKIYLSQFSNNKDHQNNLDTLKNYTIQTGKNWPPPQYLLYHHADFMIFSDICSSYLYFINIIECPKGFAFLRLCDGHMDWNWEGTFGLFLREHWSHHGCTTSTSSYFVEN